MSICLAFKLPLIALYTRHASFYGSVLLLPVSYLIKRKPVNYSSLHMGSVSCYNWLFYPTRFISVQITSLAYTYRGKPTKVLYLSGGWSFLPYRWLCSLMGGNTLSVLNTGQLKSLIQTLSNMLGKPLKSELRKKKNLPLRSKATN